MTIFMAWTDQQFPEELLGPWREVRVAAAGLAFVDSDQTLSRVYHELKWSLPDGAALAVAPLAGPPKLKGMRPRTQTWLRERLA